MSSFVSGNCSDLKISFNFLERAITHHMVLIKKVSYNYCAKRKIHLDAVH